VTTVDGPADYCREIEAYLCRKNDGHLIRIVGPAFELVTGWAERGVPFNVACAGIDRCVERYYRKGPRRRPVRVEFCEADVLDAFDDWRRAVGVAAVPRAPAIGDTDAPGDDGGRSPRRPTLAAHVERAMARLTARRASAHAAAGLDHALDQAVRSLDTALPEARRARGSARAELIARLAALDRSLLDSAIAVLDGEARQAAERDAREALAPFRDRMPPDAYVRACQAAFERAVREQHGLPVLSYDDV
jgi:hypothetical protein